MRLWVARWLGSLCTHDTQQVWKFLWQFLCRLAVLTSSTTPGQKRYRVQHPVGKGIPAVNRKYPRIPAVSEYGTPPTKNRGYPGTDTGCAECLVALGSKNDQQYTLHAYELRAVSSHSAVSQQGEKKKEIVIRTGRHTAHVPSGMRRPGVQFTTPSYHNQCSRGIT